MGCEREEGQLEAGQGRGAADVGQGGQGSKSLLPSYLFFCVSSFSFCTADFFSTPRSALVSQVTVIGKDAKKFDKQGKRTTNSGVAGSAPQDGSFLKL